MSMTTDKPQSAAAAAAAAPLPPSTILGYPRKTFLIILAAVLVVAAIAIGVAVPLATKTTTASESNTDNGDGDGENDSTTTTPVPSEWLLLGDTIEGAAWKDRFGYSLSASADGKIVAIGAVSIDDDKSFRQVQVYELLVDAAGNSGNNSTEEVVWTQLGQDLRGVDASDDFGWDVVLSDNGRVLTVGTGPGGNYVRVYSLSVDRTEWMQLGTDIVSSSNNDTGNDDSGGDCFGCAIDAIVVTMNDDDVETVMFVAVGSKDAVMTNTTTNDLMTTGVVQVFSMTDNASGEWQQIGSILQGEADKYQFGYAVALSKTIVSNNNDEEMILLRLAIGAPGGDYARVYESVSNDVTAKGGDWTLLGRVDGETVGDRFGSQVALSQDGTVLAVAAPRNSASPICFGSGHVRVYKQQQDDDGGALWNQLGDDINGDKDGQFGFSLALSADGTRLAGGANLDYGDANGFATGRVRVFDYYDDGSWMQVGDDLFGDTKGDEFGQSVALSNDGTVLVVGTKFGVGGGDDMERTGHVKAYYEEASS